MRILRTGLSGEGDNNVLTLLSRGSQTYHITCRNNSKLLTLVQKRAIVLLSLKVFMEANKSFTDENDYVILKVNEHSFNGGAKFIKYEGKKYRRTQREEK